MNPSIPDTMKAAAFDHFGGPEVIHMRSLPVPRPGPQEVLIQLDTAGIGVWDPMSARASFPWATTVPAGDRQRRRGHGGGGRRPGDPLSHR